MSWQYNQQIIGTRAVIPHNTPHTSNSIRKTLDIKLAEHISASRRKIKPVEAEALPQGGCI
jgi:hypothetical protein